MDVEGAAVKLSSVFSVKDCQSAPLKFVNEFLCHGGGEFSVLMSIVMGRRSELWIM